MKHPESMDLTVFTQNKEDLTLDVAQNLINFMTDATSKIKDILNECPYYTNGNQLGSTQMPDKFNTAKFDNASIIKNKSLAPKIKKQSISSYSSSFHNEKNSKKAHFTVPLENVLLKRKKEIKIKRINADYYAKPIYTKPIHAKPINAKTLHVKPIHAIHSKNVFSQYFKMRKKDYSYSSLYDLPKSSADSESSSKLISTEIVNNTILASKLRSLPYSTQELKTNEINFDDIIDSILLTDVIPQNELQKYLL